MKKVILLLFFPFGISGGGVTPNFNELTICVDSSYITPPVILPPQPVDELVNALIYVEEIARCWNGGPRGLKNKRTEKYWIKVQKQLNENY